MSDCKHETFKIENLIDQAEQPDQKPSFIVRCTTCGNTFPIVTESKNSTDYHLENITDKLQQIQDSIARIKGKLK